jgi:hypothetical protein
MRASLQNLRAPRNRVSFRASAGDENFAPPLTSRTGPHLGGRLELTSSYFIKIIYICQCGITERCFSLILPSVIYNEVLSVLVRSGSSLRHGLKML